MVVDKAAGEPSVPGRDPSLPRSTHDRVRDIEPGALVVHRLDMATSGLLLFALDADAQRRMSVAFQERRVQKTYVALVEGTPSGTGWSVIDLPIGFNWDDRPRRQVGGPGAKEALTRYRVLRAGPLSAVELQPHTGRTHQLRVHMAAIGHPIAGDALYGGKQANGDATAPRLLLHARSLVFDHPSTAGRLTLEAAPDFSI